LDGLRGAAELTELSVLNKNNWLWKRHEWTRLDTSIIGLRRLLGKVRWAFMPDDEIVEFASGPFLAVGDRDPGLRFKMRDLEREANRALEAVKDVVDQVEQTTALRETIKADRLNNTTYVLTAVATILLIPTLLAGIYGMNFAKLPARDWQLGFWEVLGLMMLLGTGVWLVIRSYLRRH